jgi:hypothetical protein
VPRTAAAAGPFLAPLGLVLVLAGVGVALFFSVGLADRAFAVGLERHHRVGTQLGQGVPAVDLPDRA